MIEPNQSTNSHSEYNEQFQKPNKTSKNSTKTGTSFHPKKYPEIHRTFPFVSFNSLD
jgi:hypothetical protein